MKVSVLFLLFLSGVFSVIGIANTFKMYSDARGACFARLGDEGDFNGRFTEYGKIEGFCIYGNTSKRIDMRKEGIEEATEIEEDEIIYDEFDMREDDWEIKFITMEKIEDDE